MPTLHNVLMLLRSAITLSDRYGLLAASLDENLPDEERLAVNRLLRSIKRGRVQVCL